MSNKRTITLDTVLCRSSEVLSREIASEVVMLDLKRSEYFGFDSVGTRIWNLLERATTVDNVCAQLTHEYAVDREVCERDVLDFLNALQANQLLFVDPPQQ